MKSCRRTQSCKKLQIGEIKSSLEPTSEYLGTSENQVWFKQDCSPGDYNLKQSSSPCCPQLQISPNLSRLSQSKDQKEDTNPTTFYMHNIVLVSKQLLWVFLKGIYFLINLLLGFWNWTPPSFCKIEVGGIHSFVHSRGFWIQWDLILKVQTYFYWILYSILSTV